MLTGFNRQPTNIRPLRTMSTDVVGVSLLLTLNKHLPTELTIVYIFNIEFIQ